MFERLSYIIAHKGKKFQLKHAPKEWDDGAIKWKRSKDYFGMTREFSLPNEFVKDGADILRSIFYRGSIQSEASLEIYRHRGLETGYVKVYEGDFDFSTFKDLGDSVQIDMTDNGIEADIKGNESTEYEFKEFETDRTVLIPNVQESREARGTVFLISPESRVKYSVPNIIITNDSAIQSTVAEIKQPSQLNTDNVNDIFAPQNNCHFLEINQSGTFDVNLFLDYQAFEYPFGYNMLIKMVESGTNNIVWTYQIPKNRTNLEIRQQPHLNAGRKYYIYIENTYYIQNNTYNPFETFSIPNIFDSSTISFSYSRGDTSYKVKGFSYKKLAELLIGKLTSKTANIEITKGSVLDRIVFVSGDFARYTENGTKLKDSSLITSFKDFFKSTRAVAGYGFGIDNDNVRIAPISYFFNKFLEIHNIGEIKEPEISPYTDYMAPTIKAGYKDQNYDSKLGRQEFNSAQEYSTALSRASGNIDLTAAYRADQMGMDAIRQDVEDDNIDDSDKKTDKDVFMVYVESAPMNDGVYRAETGNSFQNVSGISGTTHAINLELSPKRNLIRNLDFIGAVLQGTNTIVFESGKKNTDLITTRQVTGNYPKNEIREDSNILIEDIEGILFLPVVIKCTTALNYATLNDIKNKNNGYIRFKYKGFEYKGFILDIEANISYSDEVQMELLLHPDTNLDTLWTN